MTIVLWILVDLAKKSTLMLSDTRISSTELLLKNT